MAHGYLPAAGHDWLLPFYDPLTKLLGTEALHRRLIEQASLRPGQRVLEIGCGTGSMTTLAKTLHPDVDVVGLDPDPKALARATRKAARRRVSIALQRGFAGALPFADASYDRVLSAFMLHHLEPAEKARALREARRVLRRGGELHVLDFGADHGHADGWLARLLHRRDQFRDNATATIVALLRDAGFVAPSESGHGTTLFGRAVFHRAVRND